MACFEIKNLNFKYNLSDKKSLSDINLTIENGEFICICGKSGSGKTTLLKSLKPEIAPTGENTGSVFLLGKDVKNYSLKERASLIGFVSQDIESQIVTDTCVKELCFGLENLGTEPEKIRLRVAEMAGFFGIEDWFDKKTDELSGGQKQLLNLASVMTMQPLVLILDEPTSQLDPVAAVNFLNSVRKINAELGTTVIITEHRLDDVLEMAERIVLMEDGKISADGSLREIAYLLRKNNNDYFSAMPVPVKVFYEATGEQAESFQCPLNVKEGRMWLLESFKNKAPEFRTVSKAEASFDDYMKMPASIELKDVWFRYDRYSKDVLKGLNISIPKGCIYAILGGNGTGKSTALKTMMGILKPYRGKVFVNGKNIEKYKKGGLSRKCMAMLAQNPKEMFAKKSIRDELLEMLPAGKDEETLKHNEKVIGQVSKLCGIMDLLDRNPFDVSGGEQQRAALAKVLLTEPEILFLDEPTKGMDSIFKKQFAELLKRLKQNGITVVLVSHDVEFCAEYSDIAGLFFNGELITADATGSFFSGNSFYTTKGNRMSRGIFENAVTVQDVVDLYKKNLREV